ncbi:glycosyltransferase [Ectothiorhodospira variabilis]|uniref:glycosyltransferase n=1 Tax=Ectothiorhodospira variabilis TaxID=505694 RepID=UPI003B75C967
MRILFATDRAYTPQRFGGAESSTHSLILELRKRNHECFVVAGLISSGPLGITNRIRRKVTGIAAPVDYSCGYPVARGWDYNRALHEALTRWKPDIAVVQPCGGDTMNVVATIHNSGIPAVLHQRDVEFHSLGDMKQSTPAGVVACSNFVAREFAECYGITPVTIHNIFHKELYSCRRPGRHVTLINPIVKKGLNVTLQLAEANPHIPFLFVKSWHIPPSEEAALKTKTKQLGNISWHRSTRKMAKVYAQTRVLIAPSQWQEAWGRIASEAHISGIPVLASDIGGLPESVGPGGLLVEPQNMPAWHQALNHVWCDEQEWQKLSDRAYKYSLRSELDPNNIAYRYERYLRSIIKSA